MCWNGGWILINEEASRQLDKSVGVYTRLKQWMDAFCDTEHVIDLKVKKEVALYGKVFMANGT